MRYKKGLPREAKKEELVGLDIEMYKMSKPHRADGTFACLSIAFENGDNYQIYDSADIPRAIERLDAGLWTMQNALFDLRVLRRYNRVDQRYVHDTMLVDQDLFGGWYGKFGLDSLTRRWLGEMLPKDERKNFEGRESMTPEMEDYAVQDAISTVRIARLQIKHINEEEDGQFRHYYEIDEPTIWAILDMPPIRINVDAWLANTKTLAHLAEKSQEELGFNAFSSVQVKKEIERSLGKRIKNTNANQTLLPLLDRLASEDPTRKLIVRVLEVREARKAVSTYGESWIEQHVEDKEWVYPSWRVTGAETGRMSCAEPNIQQIPVKKMPIFRTFFIPSKSGRVLVSDASQQEIRLSAVLSGDKTLLEELDSGADLHQITADLFDIDRPKGKNTRFGLQYGMSAFGLQDYVGISLEKAEDGVTEYRKHYKGLIAWQGKMQRRAKKQFRVRTLTGRPIWINPYLMHDGGKRNAINGPVQGSAADHTKLALVKQHQMCASDNQPFRTNMVVHDETVADVHAGEMKYYKPMTVDAWAEAGKAIAPSIELPIEIASGYNWAVKK